MRATIRDVAEIAGVSQATVSYVLNSKANARISAATKRRVLEAAAKLHYRPHAVARAMASGRSRIIGVYQPHTGQSPLSAIWPMSVMRGISEALHERQYHLLLYSYRESDEPPAAAFLDGRVDGLIILAPHQNNYLVRELATTDLPTAIIGGPGLDAPRMVSVDADNIAGGRLATEHLIRLGHTRIAHIAGPEGVPNAIDRQIGYKQALRAHGLPVYPEYLVRGGFEEEAGRRAACRALTLYPRPTALFVANDIAAIGVLKACAELGMRVPEDVAIIGYDDAPVCEVSRPQLTTMRQPTEAMGFAAAGMLVDMLEKPGPIPEPHRLFPAELIVRESCGASAGIHAYCTHS